MTNSNNWAIGLQLALESGWTDADVANNLHNVVIALDELEKIFVPGVFASFMLGSNSFLNGARPLDALRLNQLDEVLAAIEGQAQGAYA